MGQAPWKGELVSALVDVLYIVTHLCLLVTWLPLDSHPSFMAPRKRKKKGLRLKVKKNMLSGKS